MSETKPSITRVVTAPIFQVPVPAAPASDSDQAAAEYVSPSKSMEETQTLKINKPSKASEYFSPSQPLDVKKS